MPERNRLSRRSVIGATLALTASWSLALAGCGSPVGGGASAGGSSGGGSAEDAARQGFQTWAIGKSLAFRNVSAKTASTGADFANVEVIAEFPAGTGDIWQEQHAYVQVRRVGGQWQPPLDFAFQPTARAVQTQEAARASTPTAAPAATVPLKMPDTTSGLTDVVVASSIDENNQPLTRANQFVPGQAVYVTYIFKHMQAGQQIRFRVSHDGQPVELSANSSTFTASQAATYNGVFKFMPAGTGNYTVDLYVDGATAPDKTVSFTVSFTVHY